MKLTLSEDFKLQLDSCVRTGVLPPYAQEYRFAKELGRLWRSDFAWPDHRLLVEIEGGSAGMGRHNRVRGFREDCYKYATAAVLGWTTLRGDQVMVRNGHLLEFTIDFLAGRNQPRIQKARGQKRYGRVPQ